MKRPEHIHLVPVAITVGLISLISLAVGTHLGYSLITLATLAAGVAIFYVVFPGSRFFSIALANSLAVYACIFIFFSEANFEAVDPKMLQVGFTLPILAFLGGAWLRRTQIRQLLEGPRRPEDAHFGRMFLWLIPVAVVGASTFFLAELAQGEGAITAIFFVAMGLILVDRTVDQQRSLRLPAGNRPAVRGLLPAHRGPCHPEFRLLHLLLCDRHRFRRDLSHHRPLRRRDRNFCSLAEPRDLSFIECLYFSIITLSTVGYGDLVPLSPLVRLIVGVQIICGVLLLLFGFSEIISYSREKTRRQD